MIIIKTLKNTENHMNWTDDKTIEALEMWEAGMPASRIAENLGPSFTKSAVIGKMHRLRNQKDKKGNRVKRMTPHTPAKKTKEKFRGRLKELERLLNDTSIPITKISECFNSHYKAVLSVAAYYEIDWPSDEKRGYWRVRDVLEITGSKKIPTLRAPGSDPFLPKPIKGPYIEKHSNPLESSKPCGLMDLDIGMCKFPLGDPSDSSFAFCGAPCNGSYCSAHHTICYGV